MNRSPQPQRQVTFTVDERVYTNLEKMANKAGMRVTPYASVLFEAAYAARCGFAGDRELDTAVARVALLWGAEIDAEAIAQILELKIPTVKRIIAVWRGEVTGR